MTVRQWFRRMKRPALPHFLRRTSPLSAVWGFDRGTPVDRYFIEKFLEAHRQDIKGRTLEVAELVYTNRYGSDVNHADVVDIDASNPEATLIADLSVTDQVPESVFDCFILTQTLHLIFDIDEAVRSAHRLLRPGGVLLATMPCVSRIAAEADEDCWRLTVPSCTRLFGNAFGVENIAVRNYGSILTCVAFLQGLAFEELTRKELERTDDNFPLIVAVRAVKAK